MPNYRRVYIDGSTVFITLVTYQRIPFLIQPEAREILRCAWKCVAKSHPFNLDAVCLLPDHIHMMITLPEYDADYSLRMREIKRLFSVRYLSLMGGFSRQNESQKSKHEAALWQRRFWEHTIRDEKDYQNHFDYIHYNPVKHEFVKDVASWEWSSFHRYVKAGIYDADWGGNFRLNDEKNFLVNDLVGWVGIISGINIEL